jgi:signal transduction histidine kinase
LALSKDFLTNLVARGKMIMETIPENRTSHKKMNPIKRKILVVDDNIEFAKTVARNLEKEGFQISLASDGNAAILAASNESPDLVLLDLKLPDIPGVELLRIMKSINEDVAVIIITAYGGERVAIDLMKAGAIDFLSKPFNFEDLLSAINNAFKISDAQKEDKKHERYPHLEKFFPFLAHEIRNPLHAISGALAIIQRRSDLKDEILGQSVKVIQEEVQHLNEFVQECLDFVRPPSESRFVEIDINEVVSFIVNTMPHRFEELSQKIQVTTDLAPQLPKFFGNYEEIKQALLNIVRNGLEAMDDGGEFIIRTAFQLDPKPGWVRVTLVDHGLGMKEENLQLLFHPFYTTKPRGTGLGLAICKRVIVERHHGKIQIESLEGKGTTVTVELPIERRRRPRKES